MIEQIHAFAHEVTDLRIETGKMGICLYFFMLADSLKNRQYQKWAEQLLDEIYEQLTQDISVKTIPEIIQAGIGFDFLVKHKYVKGGLMLKSVDKNALFFH